MYSQVVVLQHRVITSATCASGFCNVLKLDETKTHPSIATVYSKHACESLADLSQTFNAAIEILQQKDGVVGCDIIPSPSFLGSKVASERRGWIGELLPPVLVATG